MDGVTEYDRFVDGSYGEWGVIMRGWTAHNCGRTGGPSGGGCLMLAGGVEAAGLVAGIAPAIARPLCGGFCEISLSSMVNSLLRELGCSLAVCRPLFDPFRSLLLEAGVGDANSEASSGSGLGGA